MTSLSRLVLRLPGAYQALAFLLARRAVVREPSMYPTLAPGERVTVDGRTWTLGEGEWLLLGDAPDFSTDGRDFGPVGRESIHARAWFVYWPPGKVRRVRRGPRL